MNNTFSLQQVCKTGNLDSNLILRQHKLDLLTRFLDMKSVDPKLGQDQMAKQLGSSSSTLQRHRQEKKCFHLKECHQIDTKEDKRFQKIFPIKNMTSKHLKCPQKTSKD